MSSTTSDHEWPQFRTDVSYSDKSSLNTLEWCIPRPTTVRGCRRIWIIYIHGGAWRDPEINASSFNTTRDLLLKGSQADHVAGYASINYRLSSYPSHPRLPSRPNDPARNARHPDHILDVLTAISHLQETFRFEERYLLVGHSCGATLALQVAMHRSSWASEPDPSQSWISKVIPPVAILGVEGLYDLPALVAYHHDQPVYRNLVENAFGADEQIWSAVSPSRASFTTSWPDGKLIILAHSHEDELVEWEQVKLQYDGLAAQGWKPQYPRQLRLLEIRGAHDEIWIDARELARAIETATRDTIQAIAE